MKKISRTTLALPLAIATLAACAGASAQPASAASAAPPGLIYKSLRDGTGPSPTAADTVKVHYRGTLVDGTEFDSSYRRNEPAVFPLARVIKCWTEGVQRMKVGGKDFRESLNPTSKHVVAGFVESAIGAARAGDRFQFERHGYFVADLVDHDRAKPVFNRITTLRDTWSR